MADADLFAPLSSLQWVDREQLKPNDYNPNKVNRENLKLLVQSIMTMAGRFPSLCVPTTPSSTAFTAGPWPERSRAHHAQRQGAGGNRAA